MRYDSNHKELTRSHVINVAASLFKVHGTDATGLATVMKEAGLTNGAFYAHFASKEALVEAVIERQLVDQLTQFRKELGGIDGLKRIIDTYLSETHVASCAEGCLSAALIGEISKRSLATRNIYTKGLVSLMDELLHSIDSASRSNKQTILALFGLLIGTLQLARTVTDKKLAVEIIEGGRKAAYTLLDTAFSK